MQTTARRYATPATPPPLVPRPARVAVSVPVNAPVLCLRCGGDEGRAASRLVSFEWGRVVPSGLRR